MANQSHHRNRNATHQHKPRDPKTYDDHKPRNVSRRIVVTSQTAYHLTELALQEHKTEGQIIDKIMRTYLASRRLDYAPNQRY